MPPGVPPQIEPDDLHWLAGLLEGEGSFLAGPPSQPRTPALVVHMTDRDVVERVARLLGTTVQPVAPQRDHHRPTFVARVRGRRATAWMRLLAPLYRHLDREVARLVGAVLREERAGTYAHLTPTPAGAPAAGRRGRGG